MTDRARDSIKSHVQARGNIKGNVTRIINYFNETPNPDVDEIETRKFKLEEHYQSFSRVQLEIDLICADDAAAVAEQELEKANFDKQYFHCSKIINKLLRNINPSVKRTSQTLINSEGNAFSNSNITIEQTNSLANQIEIPSFNGNLREWYSFHDTFKTLVHDDPKIPAVRKFYLLKKALSGDVTSIMEPLSASEENYKVAWELLQQRCERPRKIIENHLNAILNLPAIIKETPIVIRNLKEKALMHVKALEALKQPIEHWDSILVYVIKKKLDSNNRTLWERTLEHSKLPKFSELIEFLNKHERGDETESIPQNLSNSRHDIDNKNRIFKNGKILNQRAQSFVGTHKSVSCTFCKGNHSVFMCADFLKLSARERVCAAKDKRLCTNCLRDNHLSTQCLSLQGCKTCGRRHNTLLHFAEKGPPSRAKENNRLAQNQSIEENTKTGLAVTYDSEVLLGTARVKIIDREGREHECRVLLDGCSQCHFITEKLANKLKLKREKVSLPFSGLGQLTTKSEFRVKTTIKSNSTNYAAEVEFVALPNITGRLPARKIDKRNLSIPHSIRLADPEFDKPGEIDALIGTTLFYNLLSTGQMKISKEANIILQKTLLGWIVVGEVKKQLQISRGGTCHLSTSLDAQLHRFSEVEQVPIVKHLSPQAQQCGSLYAKSTIRDSDGRYIVQLPFNHKKQNIGESYNVALKRFHLLERKLLKKMYRQIKVS